MRDIGSCSVSFAITSLNNCASVKAFLTTALLLPSRLRRLTNAFQPIKKRPVEGVFLLAASPGFEPRLTESESAVLPLDDEAICGTKEYLCHFNLQVNNFFTKTVPVSPNRQKGSAYQRSPLCYFLSSSTTLICSSSSCCCVTKFGACIIKSCALPFSGNKITSRIIGSSKSSMTSRSTP